MAEMITLKSAVKVRLRINSGTYQESGIGARLSNEAVNISYPLPLHEFDGYEMSASPYSELDGSMIRMHLDQWTFFDHARNRSVPGIVLPVGRPDCPAAWDFVRLYVRHGRLLDDDKVSQWARDFVADMRNSAAEQAIGREDGDADARG
jgi:hypothetical protein